MKIFSSVCRCSNLIAAVFFLSLGAVPVHSAGGGTGGAAVGTSGNGTGSAGVVGGSTTGGHGSSVVGGTSSGNGGGARSGSVGFSSVGPQGDAVVATGSGRGFGSSSLGVSPAQGSLRGSVNPGERFGGTGATLRSPYNNFSTGTRSAGQVSGLRSRYDNDSASPRNQPSFGNSRDAGLVVGNGAVPGVSRRFDGNNPATLRRAPQINNAWTDQRVQRTTPAARPSRYGYLGGAYDRGQSSLGDNAKPGQHLYPNAAGYDARDTTHSRSLGGSYDRGGNRRFRRQDGYHSYNFNGFYYPYFASAFFPGFYGGFFGGDYGYGYNNGFFSGVDSSGYSANITNENPSFNTTPNSAASGGYWDENGNAPSESAPAQSTDVPLPPQPGSVGPQNPTAGAPHASTQNGPDSLVEAVQDELSKRGYFPGKPDAVYGDSTREALRRFQSDRQLAVTGRINEATLHALQLD